MNQRQPKKGTNTGPTASTNRNVSSSQNVARKDSILPFSKKEPDNAITAAQRLGDHCLQTAVSHEEWLRRTEAIKDQLLRSSKHVVSPNFNSIHTHDLIRAAELYEEFFFDRMCLSTARQYGLRFRLSSRMTSAGGKTTRVVWPATLTRKSKTEYEIAISTSLLFQTFQDHNNPVKVCGVACNTRLDAMLRIMEHELIHLAEMLSWYDSDCAANRFQNIAYRMFHHTEHKHQLTTQQERAKTVFNIRVGSRVEFVMEGKVYRGLVNRITRRATVLVEAPDGVLFSDGKRYVKYYVPLTHLRNSTRIA
jgi:hypothetical protein